MVKSPSESRRSGRLARMVVFAAAAAMSMTVVSQARADVTDQLLDQLRAKGVLTRGEYSKLKSRHAAEKADMARPHHYSRDGVVVVPDDRYLTRLDKGIGFHIPGLVTKEGETGAIDVKISGDLVFAGTEAFGTHESGNIAVAPAAAGSGIIGGLVFPNHNATNAIEAGLLPSAIVLSIATNQMGYDLGFTIGAYTGGNNVEPTAVNANGPGSPLALGTPGIDLRQVFGTIGTPTFGTVKIGRDLGLFGSDAILNDATLLGVGTSAATAAPGNTTLGRIGIGYVYADWIPQVTYTTPDFNGFTASIGAFTPLDTAPVDLAGASPVSALITNSEAPMVQGQIKWKGNIAPGAALTASADGLWQEHRVTNGGVLLNGDSAVDSWGVDGFGKLDIAGFSFVAYGYYGRGLGSTGFFWNAFSLNGDSRTSYGGYGQASYTWDKFTFGGSWGISVLNANGFDDSVGVVEGYEPFLLKSNESAIGFVRYQLTPWMAIQGEYVHSWARNQGGGQITQDQIDLGTAWFF